MTDDDTREDLLRMGLQVPVEDLPFLRRARQRQLQLLSDWAAIPPDTEPALVLRVGEA